MDKTCKICGFVGDVDLFVSNRRICRVCYSNIQAGYREMVDKKEVAKYQQEYRASNYEDIKKKKYQYYEKNKEFILERQKLFYQNNSEMIKIRVAKYRKDNKDKRNAFETQKRANDPNYKLRVYFSRDIFRSVKSKNGLSTLDILPYSITELRKHLENQFEPWMTWDNHGKYDPKTWNDNDSSTWTWQIDHIIPRSQFEYLDTNDPKFIECWALSNLRPLSSKINLINGSKLKRKK